MKIIEKNERIGTLKKKKTRNYKLYFLIYIAILKSKVNSLVRVQR
jgi:hypothetical protein